MSVRTKLLSGRNINTDSDFSKYIETVSEPGVIEGLAVSTNSVAVGKCWCPCERTNGETIYALVESFSAETIDTSGTGYVIVTIGQNYIDDGSLINEDGTGVATFEVVSELPTKNYLLLATLNSGSITDSRNMIKKVGELNTAIESLTAYVNDINERVEALEEAGAIDHLEEQALVGERYNSTSQSMFVQKTPALADCTVEDCHVGDTAANTEIHIQRIANGTESNKLKLKVKMEGSPTTALKVEVRKGVQVNVSATEAYWYGDESQILATGSLAYSEFSTAWAEKEFTLDNAISVDKGTLLDIVVYQESSGTKVVNASNYYKLACDSTQWSEAFSFVSVNGSTRTRSKLMPYCISGSFAQSLLVKATNEYQLTEKMTSASAPSGGYNSTGTVSGAIFSIPTNQLTQGFTALGTVKMHIDSGTEGSGSTSGGTYPVLSIEVYNGSTTLASYGIPKSGNYSISNATVSLSSIGSYISDDNYLRFRAAWNRYGWTIKGYYLYVEIDKVPAGRVTGNPKAVAGLGEIGYLIIFDETSIYDLENRGYVSGDHYSSTAGDITSFYGYVTVTIGGNKYKLPTIGTES